MLCQKMYFQCVIDTYCIEGQVRRHLIKVHTSLVTFLILIRFKPHALIMLRKHVKLDMVDYFL